jgi:hypothetical protein
VFAAKLVIAKECDIIKLASSELEDPYDAVSPYSTKLSDISFVLQFIVAEFERGEADTKDITGASISGTPVVNV